MKKSVGIMMLAFALVLAMAVPAFANEHNEYNYYFEYQNFYDAHSSSFIVADAVESGGNVTLTLAGNYFPQFKVGGVSYSGVYDANSDTTTLTFPGSSLSNINLQLHVVVYPWHDDWYDLELIWG